MTLVDKLNGVHEGDILLLENYYYSAVGYIVDYSMKEVTLSTELPLKLQKGEPLDKFGRMISVGNGPTKLFRENRTYGLEHFDSYIILHIK